MSWLRQAPPHHRDTRGESSEGGPVGRPRRGSAVAVALAALAAATAAVAATPPAVVAAGPVLLRRPRRRGPCPLDQLLWVGEAAVLVLGDELQADAAAGLVDLLHDHVHDVPARHHVL